MGGELSSITGKMLNSLRNVLCKDYQTLNWKQRLQLMLNFSTLKRRDIATKTSFYNKWWFWLQIVDIHKLLCTILVGKKWKEKFIL